MNFFCCMTMLLSLGAAQAPMAHVAIESSLVLKVSDRNAVADTVIVEAERVHGYFTARSDDELRLRIPREQAQAMLRFIEPLGVVVDRSYRAIDRGADLTAQKTLLASRQEVLQRYFDVLKGATASNVVQVEADMSALITEIEQLQGSIRLLEHQLSYAEIVVQFQFKDRRAPARDGNSSFSWLNALNVEDLLEDFGNAY